MPGFDQNAMDVSAKSDYALFKHLSRSNQVPSMEAMIAASQREVVLQKTLRNLEDKIQQLQDEKLRMTEEVLQLQQIRATIRRVPPDVLVEIFLNVHLLEERCPLSLMGVCRVWRDVVLSTPQLWTAFRITPRNVSHCEKLFMRSGTKTPLTLIVGSHQQSFEAQRLMLWMPRYIPRIRSLALVASLPAIDLEGLLNLEVLELACYSWRAVYRVISMEKLPSLRRLRLVAMDPPRAIPSSFRQLTHVELQQELSYHEIERILHFLPECPLLRSLSIVDPSSDYYGSHREWEGAQRRVLPNVETMKLAVHKHTYVFLRLLTLPKLSEFDITGAESCWICDFEDMVNHSACPLTHLTMRMCKPFDGQAGHLPYRKHKWYARYGRDFAVEAAEELEENILIKEDRDDQILKVLSAAPTIRVLRAIDSAFLGPHLIYMLDPDMEYIASDDDTNPQSQVRGPNLQHLWVEHSETTFSTLCSNLEDSDILQMMKSRDGFEGTVEKDEDLRFAVYRSGRPTLAVKDRNMESLRAQYGPGTQAGISQHIFF